MEGLRSGVLRNRRPLVMSVTCLKTAPPIGCCNRIGDTTMQNHSMQFIRFAIGMSLIAICAIGSASASSRTQVIKQEAPTNPRSISETDFRPAIGNSF